MTNANTVDLATALTVAWLSKPGTRVEADDVPAFLQSMATTLGTLGGGGDSAEPEGSGEEHVPAVSVRKSLGSREHIISMIDGKPYRTLKRHLATNGLTPAEYRVRYGLKPDYPMVAPAYSEARSAVAKSLGLGRKKDDKAAAKSAVKPAGKPGKGSGTS